jgi:delta-aminolevulinic acid dehydratase/porphobilinogen synthase
VGGSGAERIVLESLLAIKRAGADLIISYYAELLAKLVEA